MAERRTDDPTFPPHLTSLEGFKSEMDFHSARVQWLRENGRLSRLTFCRLMTATPELIRRVSIGRIHPRP
jgi:hypothetical protein